MINVTELRPGNYFIDEGNLYRVIDILLNKTAMRKMVAKVKNYKAGFVTSDSNLCVNDTLADVLAERRK